MKVLSLVEKEDLTSVICKNLSKRLSELFQIELNCKIGFPGGNWDTVIHHNEAIWHHEYIINENGKIPRYWNGFGLAHELDKNKSNNIVVEINVPLSGFNPMISGALAIDEDNKSYLLHNGRVGGGRKGIGKRSFLNWSSRNRISLNSSKGRYDFIVIGCIEDSDFYEKLYSFIVDVHDFKVSISSCRVDCPQMLDISNIKTVLEKLDNHRKEIVISSNVRSNLIKEYAKKIADGKCQLCREVAPFNDRAGRPFLEVHHIKWLSRGGEDSINNVAALCPNCHRKMHILDSKHDVDFILENI